MAETTQTSFSVTDEIQGCCISVCVQPGVFSESVGSLASEISGSAQNKEIGAEVSFIGRVRASELKAGELRKQNVGSLSYLELEHYPAMTRAALTDICKRAIDRWQLIAIDVIHRVGQLAVGEPIVKVYVASQHRRDAYDACSFIMDFLKTDAPFWKKAVYVDGEGHWVSQKDSDLDAVRRWEIS